MKELIKRLSQHTDITVQLLISSLIINVLSLTTAMYVMQVLRRYVSYGVDATLVTLTLGALIAVVFTYIFKSLRVRLARGINHPAQDELEEKAFSTICKARSGAIMMFDQGTQQEVMTGLRFIQNAYSPNNLISILDLPFAFLFLFAIMILSPTIALVVLGFMVFMIIFNAIDQHKTKNENQEMSSISSKFTSLISSTIRSSDSVRAFNAQDTLMEKWKEDLEANKVLQDRLTTLQAKRTAFAQSITALMTIAVVCVGALQIVTYDLGIGTLIGAKILALRAFSPITGFVSTSISLDRASYYMKLLKKFFELPMEPSEGASPTNYKGGIHLKNISYTYPGAKDHLFANLTATIVPGQFNVVIGANGTGKTTLAKLLSGLIRPGRGQILIDGVDLEQHNLFWWRQQIIYLPQEPTFFDGSLRDNLKTLNPEIEDETLRDYIGKVGLASFLDQSKDGLNMTIHDNGSNLALGIRRRLAFVRGMVSEGKVAILDEPDEGLDSEGTSAVFEIIKQYRLSGKTVFLFSAKPAQQFPNADMMINLNIHPVPGIKMKSTQEEDKPS
jgi:ATP-binding cassette subfamily C protein LapB